MFGLDKEKNKEMKDSVESWVLRIEDSRLRSKFLSNLDKMYDNIDYRTPLDKVHEELK